MRNSLQRAAMTSARHPAPRDHRVHYTAAMSAPLPVTVVTGFLGAGKTTLVNRWLADFARGEVAVIVNELGRVGIDGELLATRVQTLVEITGGCICCASHAELVRALDGLAAAPVPPRRVLIETSGAASPAGVLRAIAGGGRDDAFALDGVITVVDAARVDAVCRHELAIEQIGFADLVVLSRVDTADADALAHASELIATHNGAAVCHRGTHGLVPAHPSLESLLATRSDEMPLPRERPRAAITHVYDSVSLSLEGELDGDRFADFVESVLAPQSGRLFRTKGILAIQGVDARMILQGVADTVALDFGAPWGEQPRRCRLVVVGYALDRAALAAGFAACAAR